MSGLEQSISYGWIEMMKILLDSESACRLSKYRSPYQDFNLNTVNAESQNDISYNT